jgi:site-specific DNA recombinase
LIFGADGRALSPTHTRKQGRLYRYYVSQAVLKGGADDAPYRRLPAGEIEALVLEQVRALLRQPEVVVGTWRAAQAEAPDLAEDTVRDALARFDPVWSELFPAEQERLIRLLVQRVVVGEAGAQISLNLEGLASLARDLTQPKRIAA